MSSLRIAIADDDQSTREILRKLLAGLGHSIVASVASGRSLIERCAILTPDVVITDNVMGDMTGLEAASEMYRTNPIPIIMLSAFCGPELVRRAEERHVLVYLVKPLSRDHLEAALTQCQDQIAARRHSGEQGEVLLRSEQNLAADDRLPSARFRGRND